MDQTSVFVLSPRTRRLECAAGFKPDTQPVDHSNPDSLNVWRHNDNVVVLFWQVTHICIYIIIIITINYVI